MRIYFVALSFCFLLSSCIDYKGASEPYSYVPSSSKLEFIPKETSHRLKPTMLTEDISFLNEDGPLTLGEVIDIALLNSPETKETWASARIAAAKYGKSLREDFVQAESKSFYNRSRDAQFAARQRRIVYETDWGGQFDFSYLILDFGQTRASSRSALETLYQADYTHNREIQTVIQKSMNDYYIYLSQQEQLAAAYADVENAQLTLDAVNEKFRVGLADLGQQIQAKTQLLQMQLNVVAQKQKLVTTYTELSINLGLPANQTITLQSYPDEIHTFKVATLDKLIKQAIKYRPDVLAAEAHVKSTEEAILAAKRKRFPKLRSNFDWGRTYYNVNRNHFNDGQDWQASVSLNFPLFQGFFLANEVKQAEAEFEKAKAEYEQKQLVMLQNVVDYRSDVTLAAEALTYSTEFLEAAKEDFKINLKKFKVGTGTILDVISAQTAVSDAQSKFVNAEKNWYVSVSNLAYGTGLLTLMNTHELQTLLTAGETSP